MAMISVRRYWLGVPLLFVAALFAPVVGACGDDDAGEETPQTTPTANPDPDPDPEADPDPGATTTLTASETVEVTLADFTVEPSVAEVAAGAIRFVATNEGTITHELVICEESCEAGEEAEMAEVEDVAVGEDGAFTIQLEPGEYELACLLDVDGVNHYERGMHATIEVK